MLSESKYFWKKMRQIIVNWSSEGQLHTLEEMHMAHLRRRWHLVRAQALVPVLVPSVDASLSSIQEYFCIVENLRNREEDAAIAIRIKEERSGI